ncbi:MAG: hypothetical protein K2Y37_10620 [Pirellulales bacterium]|nr:hypothetical protein [Pirellulales bacterium]
MSVSKPRAERDSVVGSAIRHWLVQAAIAAALTLICLGCASGRRAESLSNDVAKERASAIAELGGAPSPGEGDDELRAPREGSKLPSASDEIASSKERHNSARLAAGDDRRSGSAAEMAEVLAELHAIGAVDKAAEERLLEDLKSSDPALWPQVIDYAKATLAYQRVARGTAATAQATAAHPMMTAPASAAAVDGEPVTSSSAPASASIAETRRVQPAVYQASTQVAPASTPSPNVAAPISSTRQGPPHIAPPVPAMASAAVVASAPPNASAPSSTTAAPASTAGIAPAGLEAAVPAFAAPIPTPAPSNDPAAALGALEAAAARLREAGPLELRNLLFCTEVTSFGVYKPFASSQFAPGQEVLLYAEVDGFKVDSVRDGFRTALASNYEIVDRQGAAVDAREFGLTEEVCRNRRRDFFIRYQFHLPSRLADGAYTLRLKVNDALGHKTSVANIEFSIKRK